MMLHKMAPRRFQVLDHLQNIVELLLGQEHLDSFFPPNIFCFEMLLFDVTLLVYICHFNGLVFYKGKMERQGLCPDELAI